MRVRALKASDIPALRKMAENSGFPYPDLGRVQLLTVRVLVDEDDKPLMAVAARAIPEVYLWCGEMTLPHAKLFGLRLLHTDVSIELRKQGFESAEAFLPPTIAAKFARRLEKTFSWVRNWPSWTHPL